MSGALSGASPLPRAYLEIEAVQTLRSRISELEDDKLALERRVAELTARAETAEQRLLDAAPKALANDQSTMIVISTKKPVLSPMIDHLGMMPRALKARCLGFLLCVTTDRSRLPFRSTALLVDALVESWGALHIASSDFLAVGAWLNTQDGACPTAWLEQLFGVSGGKRIALRELRLRATMGKQANVCVVFANWEYEDSYAFPGPYTKWCDGSGKELLFHGPTTAIEWQMVRKVKSSSREGSTFDNTPVDLELARELGLNMAHMALDRLLANFAAGKKKKKKKRNLHWKLQIRRASLVYRGNDAAGVPASSFAHAVDLCRSLFIGQQVQWADQAMISAHTLMPSRELELFQIERPWELGTPELDLVFNPPDYDDVEGGRLHDHDLSDEFQYPNLPVSLHGPGGDCIVGYAENNYKVELMDPSELVLFVHANKTTIQAHHVIDIVIAGKLRGLN